MKRQSKEQAKLCELARMLKPDMQSRMRTIFLVYGYDHYEYPCDPIKAFSSEAEAQMLLDKINAHEGKRPAPPGDGVSDGEFNEWSAAEQRWRNSHPAGNAYCHDGFSIMPLVLV